MARKLPKKSQGETTMAVLETPAAPVVAARKARNLVPAPVAVTPPSVPVAAVVAPTTPPVTHARPVALLPEPVVIPAAVAGPAVAAGMAGIDLVIRRPTGRVQISGTEVQATNDAGVGEVIDQKKITKPSAKIDQHGDHPCWEKLDANAARFNIILSQFSVSDARRGFHIVPMSKLGAMLAAFSAARAERLALAEEFRAGWTVFIENLRLKFNGHFHLVLPKLPNPDSLLEKFDAQWTIHPLTPMDPSKFNYKDMTPDQVQAIVTESNNMAKSLIASRAKVMYDEVFGVALDKCTEIATGAMETGARKFGSITELVNVLERLKNFEEFGNPEIIAHANATLELLSGIEDINEVNRNKGQNQVTAAIKAATVPLATAIKTMMDARRGGSKARRAVEA